MLGAALGLTGPFAEIGDGQLRAVEFAVAERGSLFGHAVVLHAADATCSPEGGADAAETLMADPLVVAVVGTTCSSAAFEAAPVVSEAGSVLVSPSNSAIELTDPGTREAGYFRVFPSAAWEVEEALGPELRARLPEQPWARRSGTLSRHSCQHRTSLPLFRGLKGNLSLFDSGSDAWRTAEIPTCLGRDADTSPLQPSPSGW